jgi:hypothetical protein
LNSRSGKSAASVTSADTMIMDGYGLPMEFNITFMREGEADLRLDFTGGRITRVTLQATQGHPEILAGDTRNLPLLEFRDEAVKRLATPIKIKDGEVVMIIEANVGGYDEAKRAYNRGRGRITPEALSRVAEVVREFPKGPKDRGVASARAYQAIREEFGVADRAAQLWVKRARDKGLL